MNTKILKKNKPLTGTRGLPVGVLVAVPDSSLRPTIPIPSKFLFDKLVILI